ncbi:hypothetical protein JS77_01975 [Synergistes jonesii]|uniref:hypothetical protein n=1 Tax=Synergistes jonesii TaxID=2754 RepID=UPI0008723DD4|nr:hypothetical protein [Synergistes jonesii]OFB76506.1 hypothetical protein JS77_01975 [Synergistes jonesii]
MPGFSSIESSILSPPIARAKSYCGNIVATTFGRRPFRTPPFSVEGEEEGGGGDRRRRADQ